MVVTQGRKVGEDGANVLCLRFLVVCDFFKNKDAIILDGVLK